MLTVPLFLVDAVSSVLGEGVKFGGICDLEVEIGPCSGSHERYHYDRELGECSLFLFLL